MYRNLDSQDISENKELTNALLLKYNLQEMDTECLVKRYHNAPKKMQRLIYAILKERGFDRHEMDLFFNKNNEINLPIVSIDTIGINFFIIHVKKIL